jgi:hypothetical protein
MHVLQELRPPAGRVLLSNLLGLGVAPTAAASCANSFVVLAYFLLSGTSMM